MSLRTKMIKHNQVGYY